MGNANVALWFLFFPPMTANMDRVLGLLLLQKKTKKHVCLVKKKGCLVILFNAS